MKYSSHRNSSLFLMELMIVLFFFLIVSVFSTSMFVKAWLTSRKAGNLTQAENLAVNAVEVLESSDGSEEILMKSFPEMKKEGQKYLLCYDEKWKVCDRKENHYKMEIELKPEENRVTALITIKEQEKEIYQLDFEKHIPLCSDRKSK